MKPSKTPKKQPDKLIRKSELLQRLSLKPSKYARDLPKLIALGLKVVKINPNDKIPFFVESSVDRVIEELAKSAMGT